MKKIKFYCNPGYIGGEIEEIFEYPDDVTEDEISKNFSFWLSDTICYGWGEYKEEDNNEDEDEN